MKGLTTRDFTEASEPFALFGDWFEAAQKSEPSDPNAMALATADADGLPNVRMVLLKAVESSGFVFYSNSESAKGQELRANMRAAAVLHWKSLRRQVRFRGPVTLVTDAEADAYFASRPLLSPDRRLGKSAIAAARKPFRAGDRGRQICREIWSWRSSPAALLARLQDFPYLSRILVGGCLPSARPYRFPAAKRSGTRGARSASIHEPNRFFRRADRGATGLGADLSAASTSWRERRRLPGGPGSSRQTHQAAVCWCFFVARRTG